MNIYKVGGVCRDELLGKKPKDIDYLVLGSNEKDLLDLGYKKVGKFFATYLDPKNNNQYSFPRIENIKEDLSELEILKEDLARRDLTINSMAENSDGKIFDFFGGIQDLQDRVLRHTSTDHFKSDPIRILRIARFMSVLNNFSIAEETLDLVRKLVNENFLESLEPDRVRNEFNLAFKSSNPYRFIHTLHLFGALSWICKFFDFKQVIDRNLELSFSLLLNTEKDYDSRILMSSILATSLGIDLYLDKLLISNDLYSSIQAFKKLYNLRIPIYQSIFSKDCEKLLSKILKFDSISRIEFYIRESKIMGNEARWKEILQYLITLKNLMSEVSNQDFSEMNVEEIRLKKLEIANKYF